MSIHLLKYIWNLNLILFLQRCRTHCFHGTWYCGDNAFFMRVSFFKKCFICFEFQVTLNLPIQESMQSNTASPYGKQLRYKPHPVHEWHLSNDLSLFSAHQISQDCHISHWISVPAVKTSNNQRPALHSGRCCHSVVLLDECIVSSRNQYSFAYNLLSATQDTADKEHNPFRQMDKNYR